MTGRIDQKNLYLLLPSKVCHLAGRLMGDKHVGLVEAIKAVYASDTYRRMECEDSKMWHLGPVDLYADMTGSADGQH